MSEAPTVLTDTLGRKLTLRKLTVLDQARMMRAIGPVQASNDPYRTLVQLAFMVTDIDGVPVPFPTNEAQIDAAIGRLKDEGYLALGAYFKSEVDKAQAEAEAALQVEGGKPDPLAASAALPSFPA